MSTSILWFRNDLRLADNPALAAACEAERIVPVFVLDDEAAGAWRAGGASRWWLHGSLAALAHELEQRGATLVLRRGDARRVIPALAREAGADAVHAGRAHEPWLRAADRDIDAALKAGGIAFHRHRSALMFGPEEIATRSGTPYGVYGPFSRACFERFSPRPHIPAPEKLRGVSGIRGDALDGWHLLPRHPDWAGGLRGSWMPGEAGARERLGIFIGEALDGYDASRDEPGTSGTSMLSPHLHWGEIAIDAVWRAAADAAPGAGRTAFLKELIWREFCAHLLWHHPEMPDAPLRGEFARMPWREAPDDLRAWQRGMTGIPIVDAGMRQLWRTGWMHNRIRMVAASFLIKHLLLPWQAGEAWFHDTLVDADLASNSASWQWVAGCGADAAPYFRIFNPVLQGRKFDARGDYVRSFVPELARLPDRYIHAPWQAPDAVLKQAGISLGQDYPRPITDPGEGRDRALAAFRRIRGRAAE
ncbi:MAG TPA: deoxyribodipyrimidine photo-lyase [Acetobacteraceae bacterium]|nr:deoxyribodipyrimidine photo-lyase [Acetobacteraceae bacterium]